MKSPNRVKRFGAVILALLVACPVVTFSGDGAAVRVTAAADAVVAVNTANAATVVNAAAAARKTQPLKAPAIRTVSRKGTGVTTVTWSKNGKASGYQLQYGVKSNYKGAKSVYIGKRTTVSRKLKGLSRKSNTFIRVRCYKTVKGKKQYSAWSASAKLIVWNGKWKYAKNSKIHTDPAVLYFTNSAKSKRKDKTICINAGHGTKGGASKRTLCHPDGSPKVTGGSTKKGAKTATAVSGGTTMRDGTPEAAMNLRVARLLKDKLLAQGYNVLMLRESSDVQLDNVARTVIANYNASCHISIHYDATSSNKGAFYISVPNVSSYRKMQPVASHWKQHHALGAKLTGGLKKAGIKIYGKGYMPVDLTQTSYSTVPSVDLEVGDRASSRSDKELKRIADGIVKGVNQYYKR